MNASVDARLAGLARSSAWLCRTLRVGAAPDPATLLACARTELSFVAVESDSTPGTGNELSRPCRGPT